MNLFLGHPHNDIDRWGNSVVTSDRTSCASSSDSDTVLSLLVYGVCLWSLFVIWYSIMKLFSVERSDTLGAFMHFMKLTKWNKIYNKINRPFGGRHFLDIITTCLRRKLLLSWHFAAKFSLVCTPPSVWGKATQTLHVYATKSTFTKHKLLTDVRVDARACYLSEARA